MARDRDPVCKQCRREGEKLFLKGDRCWSSKCSFERKGYPPGQHGQARRFKQSDFGMQLREKQKMRRIYGVLENQFRNYFEKAERAPGITGENLLRMLEKRLDNVVYRIGLAPSRRAARQLVRHRHFLVNKRVVDVPSYLLKAGDRIRVRDSSKKMIIFHQSMQRAREGERVPYLSLDKAKLEGTLLEIPERKDIPVKVNEQLVVERYSR